MIVPYQYMKSFLILPHNGAVFSYIIYNSFDPTEGHLFI